MPETKRNPLVAVICLVLGLGTLLLFLPLSTYDFINYDDKGYVTENAQVKAGLSWQGLAWAFTTGWAANWHPLTWLSHMADYQIFGMNAGGHHMINALLHVANSVLLFFVIKRMTQKPWPSAFVAALFAWHPLHVESVAWVSERKDVLSTFFFTLTLWAYAGYVESTRLQHAEMPVQKSKKSPPAPKPHSGARTYFLSLLWFACGLMSKPMLVTLPFVLLLLDFWPLRRFPPASHPGRFLGSLVKEKLPFFALTLGSSLVTFIVQRSAGAMPSLERLSIGERLSNALISYGRYLARMFWPENLCIFYPHPGAWPLWQVAGVTVILSLVTGIAFWLRKSRAYLLVGWLWFLGTLVPVLGLVQVGSQSMADRYSYIPLIGLFLALAWGANDLLGRYPAGRIVFVPVATLVLIACASLTAAQVRFWKNSETLFSHALAVTHHNLTAELCLGCALADDGRLAEGLAHLEEALRLDPKFADVHGKVAYIRAGEGRFDEALAHYQAALESKPDLTEALNNLAWMRATHPQARFRNGPEGVRLAERACQLTHNEKTIYIGTLAAAYAEAGQFDQAIATASRARDRALRWKETELAERNRQLLEFYRARKPYHETTIP